MVSTVLNRLILITVSALVLACGGGNRKPLSAREPAPSHSTVGKASWYGGKFHGRKTASGERFDRRAMTAAHRKLPFGTRVRITNLSNGKSVEVRITDRGPFGRRERIIDLSEAAAEAIGMKGAGVARIELEVLSLPESDAP